MKAELEFPTIESVTCNEEMLKHLNEWCRGRAPNGAELKAELRRYIKERLANAPREELELAVAENCAAGILEAFKEIIKQIEIPESKMFSEDGFST